ncbi:uncharacterized protein LOC128868455 [Anastrepha ludens]|uniref:uncharacterized protein LOC128868455 n=1 Tax=Anastrepha ludens TaxID=28586 RepID=UPI0023B01666|nr:uncharacterized protein LOC128868455 [Anastrepha ludens]
MKRTLFSYFERLDPESEPKIKKKEKQIENTEKSNLEENTVEQTLEQSVKQSAEKNTSIQNEIPPSFKNDIASATTKLSSKKNANEILNIVNDSWVPPANFSFPKSTTKNLSFQRKWLEEFYWLAYSAKENGAYCKYCIAFGIKTGGIGNVSLGKLIKKPFKSRVSKTRKRNFSKPQKP